MLRMLTMKLAVSSFFFSYEQIRDMANQLVGESSEEVIRLVWGMQG